MKSLVVRSVSLYAFNVVVLLVIGLVLPQVRVGWHALWAAVILTAVTLALKPALKRVISGAASRAAGARAGEKLVQYAIVFVVELIVWVLTVIFSGVDVRGFFWGYVIPPLLLLLAWVIYDQIDDRVQAKTAELYDSVQARVGRARAADAAARPSAPRSPDPKAGAADGTGADGRDAGRGDPYDGLTPEQRRMLDEL